MIESPTKTMRHLELHSPNEFNIDQDDIASSPMKSPPVKSTPSAPRMPSAEDDDDDDENRSRECRDGNGSFRLSPIGRMDFSTPNNMNVSDTPNGVGNTSFLADAARDDSRNDAMNSSFPDNRDDFEIHGPAMDEEEVEETEEDRMQREIEESEALARQLMAEEAMASYAMSTDFLRDNADQFSSEDLAALQAAMAEEYPEANNEELAGHEEEEEEGDSQEMSYDALLRLGEQIGNVKDERWALIAREKMNQLPTLAWVPSMAEGKEENHTEVKCQVCQFPYEEGDVLRQLPCQHCFHKDCVDSWLETKDTCAFCRKSIVPEK
mmetsp:Transcript_29173/g.62031  ORF Transcript_29173/g.62031 Transcript_29173/m.62031 type:complete len:323 (-) Transcript_29173:122-1090(-)|eukprot:CAMPEP_0172320694 /NCGR_PEP_ID=MMETSP1058-20130122/41196_1 /TAXON_ID=83371 /ORGANISM="Detonula confervacea, Strain CCMP 353" /LENGTH=322 /DNA_ID=CAMNT_0013036011 /DNA_START=40 /DNA_END=1008 /DNA_ORIENTATION=-